MNQNLYVGANFPEPRPEVLVANFQILGVDGEVALHPERLGDADILAKRVCYCSLLTEEGRAKLREANIPEGYCARCGECGAPGHACHYPGPAPYMSSWCDRCYLVSVRRTPPFRIGG